jgi:hypothetical protein
MDDDDDEDDEDDEDGADESGHGMLHQVTLVPPHPRSDGRPRRRTAGIHPARDHSRRESLESLARMEQEKDEPPSKGVMV